MNDLKQQLWPFYDESVLAELPRIAAMPDLGAVDSHPIVTAFENQFKDYFGGGLSAFYNSGTSAYNAALFALDIDVGSEVIVPAYSFRGTVTPLFQFGLVPVLVSCDKSGSISPDAVSHAINSRTRAIVINHQWGLPVDMDSICALARRHSLKVIEDASHAHATKIYGKKVGSFGDITFFSCGTTKMISGGLGGILYSKNSDLMDRALVFGLAKHRCAAEIHNPEVLPLGHTGVGVNLRGHPLAAHLAQSHLKKIDQISAQKKQNVAKYEALLTEFLPIYPLQKPTRWSDGVWYKLPCRVENPDLKAKLLQTAALTGIGVKPVDQPLGEQFALSIDIGKNILNSHRFSFSYINLNEEFNLDDVLLFDTRDLYSEVNWELCKQKLKSWSKLLNI